MKSVTKTFTVYPVYYKNTDQECDAEVTVTAEFSYDSDYGADADGNRGRATWWLEDFKVEEATFLGESIPVNSEIESAVEDHINDIHFDL
jgi:hypothetical protein